ncbi:MAG: hypothetical protein GYA62_16465, partial [Bacteroidales bacterium]|nr:hypothetical protein [Bacteroidales bacterium]
YLFTSPTSPFINKQVTIKVNGNERIITIPYVNPGFLKTHPPIKKAQRISEPNKMARIGSKKAGDYPEVPAPYELFGYPLDPKDQKRCEGERKIEELYKLAASINTQNYIEVINNAYTIYAEIFTNYIEYTDICAVMQLYLKELYVKLYKEFGTFDYFGSTSNFYFQYNQLVSQYSHLKDSNSAMKAFFDICERRKSEIKANDKRLIESNITCLKNIDDYNKQLQLIKETINYGVPTEESQKGFADKIANIYNQMFSQYQTIYTNYMSMNDKKSADSILKIEKTPEGYSVSGKLYEVYSSIPYKQAFKYQYTTCVPSTPTSRDCSGEYVTKTGEVNVKLYRDANRFLYLVKETRESQSLDKIDEVESDGQSRNQKRVLAICDFINDFKPSSGSAEDNKAEEKIDEAQLTRYKKYAYARSESEGYEIFDYYKRKPKIKEIYFSKNEDIKLAETDIVSPREFVTLRAKYDFNDYNDSTPDYAFLCKVYTVKPAIDSTPPLPVIAAKNKAEPEIDRQKFVTLIPDNLGWGFYAKFLINENELDDKIPESPVVKLKSKNSRTRKLPANEIVYKNIVPANEKESIACFDADYFTNELFSIYDKNSYFCTKDNKSNRNIAGYSINLNFSDNNTHFTPADIFNKRIDNISKEFLKAGGGRHVLAMRYEEGETKTGIVFVRNQADWFIVDSHGWTSNSSGGISSKSDGIQLKPCELIKKDGTSEYSENMDVLVLITCNSLSYEGIKYAPADDHLVFAKGWHKVLPNGIILGYKHGIASTFPDIILQHLNTYLNQIISSGHTPTPNEIAEAWMNLNAQLYSKFEIDDDVDYFDARGAAVISMVDNHHQWKAVKTKVVNNYKEAHQNPILIKVTDSVDPDVHHYIFDPSLIETYNMEE